MIVALFLFDLTLLVLATMRLGRFFVTDYLGRRILKRVGLLDYEYTRKLFGCLFCWGFWAGAGWLTLLWAAGGPGYADPWWRYIAGAFALSELAAHIGIRLGDGGYAGDDDDDEPA